MKYLNESSPITATVYFIAVLLPLMAVRNPIFAITAILGAVISSFNPIVNLRRRGFYVLLFIIMAVANPIFSHNGATVLFLINDTPITLESALYGIYSATAVTAVLLWFASVSAVFTSDKLLYLFGLFSPKLSLVLSSAMRYVPLFSRRLHEIEYAARGLGLYSDDNVVDTVRGKLRVYSVMTTWALEDGIHTADSMAARGYGVCRRTQYRRFRFRIDDAVFCAATVIFAIPTVIADVTGALDTVFFPVISLPSPSALNYLSYISYTATALIPTVADIIGELKWKYLTSKI